MDIIINRTESGEQYLEYNMLGGVIDLTFFNGPSPITAVQQYARLVGLPAMVPYWAFGFNQCRYGYQDAYAIAEVIYNYSVAEIPLEIMWTDIDYMDRRKVFTNDPKRFSLHMMREIIQHLHAKDQKYTVMVDPAVAFENNSAYERGMEANVFLKNPDGTLFKGVVWPGVTVFPDWFHPNAQGWWNYEFELFFDPVAGIDIDQCWIDMNDPSSFGCEFGCDPAEVVAKSDIFPPEPPPVRKPPRPLLGWSYAFQPEGIDCEEFVDLSFEEFSLQSHEISEPDESILEKRMSERKHMGLKKCDLLYPQCSIHNSWAYKSYWNDEEGGLSNFTVNTDLIHANGLAEYDTHNLYGHMMSVATRISMLKRRPNVRPSIITRSTFASSGRYAGKWTGDNMSS